MKKIINYIKYIYFVIMLFFIPKKGDKYILRLIDKKRGEIKRGIKAKRDIKIMKEIIETAFDIATLKVLKEEIKK